MSLKTKRALATEALRRMRVVGLNEDPAAEVMTTVTDKYDTKLEEWRERSLVYWENTGLDTKEIPAACFDTLVALTINVTEAQFGRNPQISALDRQAIEDRLLGALRRHTRMRTSGLPLQVEYF